MANQRAASADRARPVQLALALDVADFDEARALATQLRPYFSIAKVGLELFSVAGIAAVTELRNEGFDVFVDLKLHDIPTTVRRAASALGHLGASYITMHTAGGRAMLEAGVEGLAEGAAQAGHGPAMALGVTVLTSDAAASSSLIEARALLAKESGCGGLVCAAPDLAFVRGLVPLLSCVVPGTRPPGVSSDDQARVATPQEAVELGADILVIGRAVTAASDPSAAAFELAASVGLTASHS